MQRFYRVVLATLLVLGTWATVTGVLAEAPEESQPSRPAALAPLASESLAGQALILTPSDAWHRAAVSVSGPEGFHRVERFEPDETIRLELAPEDDAALADGAYRYELRLIRRGTEGPRERVQQGLFFVEGGNAVSRGAKRRELATLRRELQSESEEMTSITEESYFTAEFLAITDDNDSGTTFLVLYNDEDASSGGPDDQWLMKNEYGNLEFEFYDYSDTNSYSVLGLRPHEAYVGIGTFNPQHEIHIFPRLTSGTLGSYRTAEIYLYTYSSLVSSNRAWQITAGTSEFTVEDVTAGTRPLRIFGGTQSDAIRISSNSVDLGTDLEVLEGEVTTDGVRFSSSRTEKEDLEPVDPQEVLERLERVPVAEWSFKDDEDGARHIGPTAEDFQEAFPLPGKSEKHLSAMDVQGVALAAIQGLSQRLEAMEKENAALRARLAELESRLEEPHPDEPEEPTEQ